MDLTVVSLLTYAVFVLSIGYFLPFIANRSLARILGWAMAVAAVFYTTAVTTHESAFYRMVAIVAMQLLAMKPLVLVETYAGRNNLSFVQWSAFAIGWFGMRPALFETLPSPPLAQKGLVLKGFSRIVLGVLLLYLSALVERLSYKIFFASELLLLVGLSVILHFGVLNLSTAVWRMLGVDARELFRAPYRARSLREFWGKRWNIAFSEMTTLIAYRPLKYIVSTNTAMILSFLLSGVLHEIAISFPVCSGYGLPLLYFTIHGLLMHAESRSAAIQSILAHRIWCHVWVLGWLILPMPLLFHAPFVTQVLKPLRSAILMI
jgi:hypothetical protein